jgi:hypothetical protein
VSTTLLPAPNLAITTGAKVPETARNAEALVTDALAFLTEKLPRWMAGHPTAPRQVLDHIEAILGDFEMCPDPGWWKEMFLVTGQHMILDDEGWWPGEAKHLYDPEDILDEVNEPVFVPQHNDSPSGRSDG